MQPNYFLSFLFQLQSFQLTEDKCKALLIQAICNILMKCKDNRYRLVCLEEPNTNTKDANTETEMENVQNDEQSASLESDAKMNVRYGQTIAYTI